jgi:methyl-accepting chemotaxis protein
MEWYKNLKISVKLLVGFSLVAVLAAAMGVLGYQKVHVLAEADRFLYEFNATSLEYLGEFQGAWREQEARLFAAATASSETARDQDLREVAKLDEEAVELLKKYAPTCYVEADKAALERLQVLHRAFQSDRERVIGLIRAGETEKALEFLSGDFQKNMDAEGEQVTKMAQSDSGSAKEASEKNGVLADSTGRTLIGLAIGAFVLAIVLGVMIARSISTPVKAVVDAANKVAVGDLTVKLIADRRDEVGVLSQAFQSMIEGMEKVTKASQEIASGNLNVEVKERSDKDELMKSLATMVQKLGTVVQDVKAAVDNVASGSQEMSASSEELSQGASEQASSIEEVSSSME